jgi:hypothetical protein
VYIGCARDGQNFTSFPYIFSFFFGGEGLGLVGGRKRRKKLNSHARTTAVASDDDEGRRRAERRRRMPKREARRVDAIGFSRYSLPLYSFLIGQKKREKPAVGVNRAEKRNPSQREFYKRKKGVPQIHTRYYINTRNVYLDL